MNMVIEKYSMGIGDRFACQGKAQLTAFAAARDRGIEVTPVWNKSNREHAIVGTVPASVRQEADLAVAALGWKGAYHVDADHISLKNVDAFLAASDFFTLDVADFVGKPAADAEVAAFVARCMKYLPSPQIPGISEPLMISKDDVQLIARKYLMAVQEAAKLYRQIEQVKGKGAFITEVSMDETDSAQNPVELFFILAAISFHGIPAQTIAPKFTGRFNKGVDYVGDLRQFEKEFNQNLSVIAFAVREFDLPGTLKLSVHSGSDKFSIYPIINQALKSHGAGLHLKTAGTTWLEELIGLAESGGEGLAIAQEVYAAALDHFDELCAPYATVIDINRSLLPSPDEVRRWSGADFASVLRHDQRCPRYNLHVRQLLHVGYKVAARMGSRYLNALRVNEAVVAAHVTNNILNRHLLPVFEAK